MAGAENNLVLPSREKGSFYGVNFADFFIVCQGTVCDNKAQAGGAMGGGFDVLCSADGLNDFFCYLSIIVTHRFPP